MKFFVQPDSTRRARPPVRVFLGFALLLVIGIAAQRVVQGGLSPASIEASYLTEVGAFAQPALWEEVHLYAFLYGFLALMIGSLLIASPVPTSLRTGTLLALGATTLADLFAPFAVIALRTGALRVATFASATAALLASIAVAWYAFGRKEAAPLA
jgi:hypothetical protein